MNFHAWKKQERLSSHFSEVKLWYFCYKGSPGEADKSGKSTSIWKQNEIVPGGRTAPSGSGDWAQKTDDFLVGEFGELRSSRRGFPGFV